MLPTALIVFREVLGGALVVGIVLAASQGVRGRGAWVGAGVAAGAVGALLVGGFAEEIAAALAGVGQELFNAAVLFTAVVMLGWHNVWMGRHGRELAVEAGDVGQPLRAGARPLLPLAGGGGASRVAASSGVGVVLFNHLAAHRPHPGSFRRRLALRVVPPLR